MQGGLHHLPVLPNDLDQVLPEGTRVLKDDGLFLADRAVAHALSFLSFIRSANAESLERFQQKLMH